jgi:hypothetical protein
VPRIFACSAKSFKQLAFRRSNSDRNSENISAEQRQNSDIIATNSRIISGIFATISGGRSAEIGS